MNIEIGVDVNDINNVLFYKFELCFFLNIFYLIYFLKGYINWFNVFVI